MLTDQTWSGRNRTLLLKQCYFVKAIKWTHILQFLHRSQTKHALCWIWSVELIDLHWLWYLWGASMMSRFDWWSLPQIMQAMGFVVFTHPVFLVCEKAVGVHTKSILRRVLVRLPIVAIMWFLALAVPFFGPINSVMGALLVTSSVYIIPLAAFIITYSTKSARQVRSSNFRV